MDHTYWMIVCEYHNTDTCYKLMSDKVSALEEARETAEYEAGSSGYELEIIVDNEYHFRARTHPEGSYVYIQKLVLDSWEF